MADYDNGPKTGLITAGSIYQTVFSSSISALLCGYCFLNRSISIFTLSVAPSFLIRLR
jgi:hypothetical protein